MGWALLGTPTASTVSEGECNSTDQNLDPDEQSILLVAAEVTLAVFAPLRVAAEASLPVEWVPHSETVVVPIRPAVGPAPEAAPTAADTADVWDRLQKLDDPADWVLAPPGP